MKNYAKPVVLANADLAEGIYAASGADSTCYTVNAIIHQRPVTGRNDYRIKVNAKHNADHCCNGQLLVLKFNKPVEYISSSGQLKENFGNVLRIMYTYWNNPHDNIGLGDIVVKAKEGLEITGSYIIDTNWQ